VDLHLEDKVFIVTGGAKGIGAAIVRLLTDEGAIVSFVDKDLHAGKILEQQNPNNVFFIHSGLESAACEKAVADVMKRFGRIDGLINNAGVNDGIGLEQGSPEKFRHSLLSNAEHYFSMAHFCLPYLKISCGAIVNIGSKTAFTGQGSTSGYAGAKGAILAFTREWAAELLRYNIRVNAVIPAEVWTPMYEAWIKSFHDADKKLQKTIDRIPLGRRMTKPEEIADTVVFLLSDRASHITGQWVHVDGGYTHLDRALPS
jgi:L-fucose dehydrogenase